MTNTHISYTIHIHSHSWDKLYRLLLNSYAKNFRAVSTMRLCNCNISEYRWILSRIALNLCKTELRTYWNLCSIQKVLKNGTLNTFGKREKIQHFYFQAINWKIHIKFLDGFVLFICSLLFVILPTDELNNSLNVLKS